MAGNAAAVVAEVAGARHILCLDRGHRLEIRRCGGDPTVIEGRPVTEFAAAVDAGGKLHIAAWLLSRHLMYYTSADSVLFTHSTLLKGDGSLRLKDCMVHCGDAVNVAYVAETEQADTLVCYRFAGGDWEGRRVVEVEHPQRLSAYQFDGAPDSPQILFAVKDFNRTSVMARPASGEGAADTVASVTGALTDFCALTVGGARQACWIADGYLIINGMRQNEEPWTRTWPYLMRDEGGILCLWLENGLLGGMLLGAQRAMLRGAAMHDPMPCMLALPGESRRAVVDGGTLRESRPQPEATERARPGAAPAQRDERTGQELTLTDVVRNQAVYLTRMQESVGSLERNMLRLQAEVNRLKVEVGVLMKEKQKTEG